MTEQMQNILAWMPGGPEWIVILIVGLLLFGKRLPEVAKTLGKSVNEFKKGLNEIQQTKDEVTSDITKVKDDVINQTKDAAGPKDIDRP